MAMDVSDEAKRGVCWHVVGFYNASWLGRVDGNTEVQLQAYVSLPLAIVGHTLLNILPDYYWLLTTCVTVRGWFEYSKMHTK